MLKIANQVTAHIANVFFPPICAGCGVFVAKNGTICAKCWGGLRFISKPYCKIMGTPFAYTPINQETHEQLLSIEALTNPPPFYRARSALIHEGLAKNLVTRLKYGDHTELAHFMANWMCLAGLDLLKDCDIIIPVPLHMRRFLKRHYNQSAELARNISKNTKKPMYVDIVLRKRNTKPQVGLNAKARLKNVEGAFYINKKWQDSLNNCKILLIDDVYTTGATIRSAAQCLKKNGVKHIDVLTFSRVLPNELAGFTK